MTNDGPAQTGHRLLRGATFRRRALFRDELSGVQRLSFAGVNRDAMK